MNNLPTIRSAFASLSADSSRGYAVLDLPEVMSIMTRGLQDSNALDGVKLRATYDAPSTKWSVQAVYPNVTLDIPELGFIGVGAVHSAFLGITGADNGMESLRGGGGVIRIRCLNASQSIANLPGLNWKRVHKGTVAEIRALVAKMPRAFGAMLADMKATWARAAYDQFVDSKGVALSPTEAITRLVAHKLIPLGGKTEYQAIAYYLQAYGAENHPESAAGVIMALQRAAHEGTWSTKWAQSEIETVASELLYSSDRVLPEIRA